MFQSIGYQYQAKFQMKVAYALSHKHRNELFLGVEGVG